MHAQPPLSGQQHDHLLQDRHGRGTPCHASAAEDVDEGSVWVLRDVCARGSGVLAGGERGGPPDGSRRREPSAPHPRQPGFECPTLYQPGVRDCSD